MRVMPEPGVFPSYSPADVEALRRLAADGADLLGARRARGLLLLAEGRSYGEAAVGVGVSKQSASNWVRAFSAGGVDSLRSARIPLAPGARVLSLSAREVAELERLAADAADARVARRARAMLALGAGRSLAEAAAEVGVSRSVVYGWSVAYRD